MIEKNIIYHEDCLSGMLKIPDKSIDMILCDLPYGTTICKWDIQIPFDILWNNYKRIIKDNGIVALFGVQPFTSKLILSNLAMFKYEIIWQKDKGVNYITANKSIMKAHENICIFYKKQPIYNPQMTISTPYYKKQISKSFGETHKVLPPIDKDNNETRYPLSVQKFSRDCVRDKTKSHPTAKPIKLLEWLIKTYTNENHIVLDNCIGSGSTAIAALNTKRFYIGFETEKKYIDIALSRIANLNERLPVVLHI